MQVQVKPMVFNLIPQCTNTMVYCGKKVLTSRISGPDKYRQVVLGVRRGVYGPMVNYCESFSAFWIDVGNMR